LNRVLHHTGRHSSLQHSFSEGVFSGRTSYTPLAMVYFVIVLTNAGLQTVYTVLIL